MRNESGPLVDGADNIGRTLQRLGRPKEALVYYERFLQAETKPDPDTQKRVNEYMAQARALLGPDSADKPATDKPATDKPATDKPVSTQPAPPPPPQPPPPGRNLIIAGAAVAGVGVIGLATGAGLYFASASHSDKYFANNDEFVKRDELAAAKSLGTGSVIAYAIGGAALLGGGALIGLGAKKYVEHRRARAASPGPAAPAPATPPRASALFVPGPGGAMLVLSGAY